MKIISIVGARPNFIKVAPVHKAFHKSPHKVDHKICHTGQHFDKNMSKIFFDELEMPEPDFYLGVGSGSHAIQTGRIMTELERVFETENPDLVLVPGDVNSTLAASLTASKMGIAIGHIESGLRSYDRRMPEEINRIITDVLSDYLFVSEPDGLKNLRAEGISKNKVHFVGNVMIDSLINYLPKIERSLILSHLGLESSSFILCTFHRPSNVDDPEQLVRLATLLHELSEANTIVFPMHPRTRKNMDRAGLLKNPPENLIFTGPAGYLDFLSLVKNAALVVTDSGGIQEETTYLGVQCITVRDNTERPVTVDVGTNQLIGSNLKNVGDAAREVLSGKTKKGKIPELWDGLAAERIVEVIMKNPIPEAR